MGAERQEGEAKCSGSGYKDFFHRSIWLARSAEHLAWTGLEAKRYLLGSGAGVHSAKKAAGSVAADKIEADRFEVHRLPTFFDGSNGEDRQPFGNFDDPKFERREGDVIAGFGRGAP